MAKRNKHRLVWVLLALTLVWQEEITRQGEHRWVGEGCSQPAPIVVAGDPGGHGG